MCVHRTLLFVMLIAVITAPVAIAQELKLRVTAAAERSVIRLEFNEPTVLQRLSGLSQDELASAVRVYVSETQEIPRDRPSVLGQLTIDPRGILFAPKYPLTAGVRYWIVVAQRPDSRITASLLIDAPKLKPSTRVTEIYPTVDRLPENLLKFYVYFSAPMSFGSAYSHITLVDHEGQPLKQPFLEIAEELWDPSGTRLTILLDPARVKRGLVPREEEGPVLYEGKRYQLIVKSTWEDSQGTPLVANTAKSFTVVGNDFVSPSPSKWKISVPELNSSDSLKIKLDESLDHAIVKRGIVVVDAQGKRVDGTVTLADHETVWDFRPAQPWKAGRFTLQIADIIEDLAGNSIARPFEVDRFDRFETPTIKQSTLHFEIGSK